MVQIILNTSNISGLTKSFVVMGTINDNYVTPLIQIAPGAQEVDLKDATEIQIALIDGETNILLDSIPLNNNVKTITYNAPIETSYTINGTPPSTNTVPNSVQTNYIPPNNNSRFVNVPVDMGRHSHCRDSGCKTARCNKMRSKCSRCNH